MPKIFYAMKAINRMQWVKSRCTPTLQMIPLSKSSCLGVLGYPKAIEKIKINVKVHTYIMHS